ncbi:hypothetical protein D3C80_1053670 [compost metagenome]
MRIRADRATAAGAARRPSAARWIAAFRGEIKRTSSQTDAADRLLGLSDRGGACRGALRAREGTSRTITRANPFDFPGLRRRRALQRTVAAGLGRLILQSLEIFDERRRQRAAGPALSGGRTTAETRDPERSADAPGYADADGGGQPHDDGATGGACRRRTLHSSARCDGCGLGGASGRGDGARRSGRLAVDRHA